MAGTFLGEVRENNERDTVSTVRGPLFMWLAKPVLVHTIWHDHDAFSSRSAIQTLMIDCRGTPSLLASLSSR